MDLFVRLRLETERLLAEAVAAEREACAAVAEESARRNESCPSDCRCADGYHIAARIRARGTKEVLG